MCNSEIPKTGALTVKYLSSNLMKNHQFVTIGPFLFYALPPKHWKELFITVCWNMWKGVLQIISLVFSQIDIPYATANINSLMKYLKPSQKWMCCTWILGMLLIRCLLKKLNSIGITGKLYGRGWGNTCNNVPSVSESVTLCQPFARCSQECHRVVCWDPCFYCFHQWPSRMHQVCNTFHFCWWHKVLSIDPQKTLTNFKKISIMLLTGVTLQTSYSL